MGSSAGFLYRPLTTATAVTVAAVVADLPDKLLPPRSPAVATINPSEAGEESKSWVSQISVSNLPNLSFASRFHIPVAKIIHLAPSTTYPCTPNSLLNSVSSTIASSPILLTLYRSANLAKVPQAVELTPIAPSPPSDVLYRWHLPISNTYGRSDTTECASAKSRTVVILLGWLGAKQKHLKRYADWYTSRGFHAITFTFPMSDVISYKVGGKAEQDIDSLVDHLANWVEEEEWKNLVFHTFSNTGWLTYGVILEKFQSQDPSLMSRIKGCIVDSAPVASPDPQVWASGFSAAFLKKQSNATKGSPSSHEADEFLIGNGNTVEPRPAVAEMALLAVLEKFFKVVLNLPSINRRLSDVLGLLSSEQPKCPQLYIYSSADKVIPVQSVESFIEKQRSAGHVVRACNFVSSPHVDHFRNDPNLYTSQLTTFIEDCVLPPCKVSA